MRIRAKANTGTVGKLNVTPLIDVIMVLIIFFLLVGRLADQTRADREVKITLPATSSGTVADGNDRAIIITVDGAQAEGGAQPTVLLDGELVGTAEALRAKLESMGAKGRSVHLRADRSTPYATISPSVEACRDAGVVSIKLISQRLPTDTRSGEGKAP